MECTEGMFCSDTNPAHEILSSTNTLLLHIYMLSIYSATVHFTILFETLIDSKHSKIAVHFSSDRSGYLTSPGYGDGGLCRLRCVKDWYRLDVPQGHVAISSLADYVRAAVKWRQILNCKYGFVAVYVEKHGQKELVLDGCDVDEVLRSKPFVFNSSLWFYFFTETASRETFFSDVQTFVSRFTVPIRCRTCY